MTVAVALTNRVARREQRLKTGRTLTYPSTSLQTDMASCSEFGD